MAELATYIPLTDAARRYHLNPHGLKRAVESGRMKAIRVNGSVAVSTDDAQTLSKRQELWMRAASLDGQPIGVEDASKKYNLGTASIYTSIRQGYIRMQDK